MENRKVVKLYDDEVVVLEHNRQQEIFRIPLKFLGLTVKKQNITHAYWILYLAQYEGVTLHTLYSLARMIQQCCPHNNVDWHLIFYSFEKLDYALKMQQLQDGLNATFTSPENVLYKATHITDEQLEEELFSITRRNLADYHIVNN